jgi:hypothetical protein
MRGERILGRFVIAERLGSGGFGTVYRAWDERLHRAVAVKVVERSGNAGRVTREAQAAARLAHRNIATLYELATDGDCAYLVGELVDGRTLRALGREGGLSDRAVAEIGAEAAAALGHAHRNGVVHRDVKPDNVIVPDAGGGAKLVDFGIARVAGAGTLTATGSVLGTLAYMAPEQADGLRPGPSADVYSLALTLYEAWAGEHPLAQGGPAAIARAIGGQVPSLGGARPDLPPALAAIIDDSLDPNPEARPLASELETTLAAHAPQLSGKPLPAVAAPTEPEEARSPRRAPRPARAACAGALGAISLASLAWAGAPPLLIAILPVLSAVLGLARPRAGLLLAGAGSAAWMALGAGEPGSALLVLVLSAPLVLVPLELGPAVALPPLAPLLGAVGLAGGYPVLAGLPRRGLERALLGATGYLWLVAAEALSGRKLLLGGLDPVPPGWSEHADTAIGEVIVPLLGPTVLLGAAIWGLAALALPVVVRGRFGALDLIGATLWAAALVSAERLVSGGEADAGGLLVAVIVVAVASVGVTRRSRRGREGGGGRAAAPPRHASPATEAA